MRSLALFMAITPDGKRETEEDPHSYTILDIAKYKLTS